MKSKYYPNGSLLDATPKSGSSFTWQSILKGLETFKKGYIWRVGSGEDIKIWSDPWIPSSPDRKVITPRGQTILTKVCELIDQVQGTWDEDLVRNIFNPVDARRILQIPLNHHAFEDFIAWQPNKSGIFSVKTAYHMQWIQSYRAHANMMGRPGDSTPLTVWSTLWKLHVLRKVQIFCWRALRGILPLKAILTNRHVGSNGACLICNQGAEDVKHLLFQCSHAKELWRRLGITDHIELALPVDRSGSVVLEHLFSLADEQVRVHPVLNIK